MSNPDPARMEAFSNGVFTITIVLLIPDARPERAPPQVQHT
jgi:hypothetical protein